MKQEDFINKGTPKNLLCRATLNVSKPGIEHAGACAFSG